jgi:uncharacterized delta-60 repeat protein
LRQLRIIIAGIGLATAAAFSGVTATAATASPAGTASAVSTAAGGPGSLDPTFGNGGVALASVGGQPAATDAVLQSNGDIVVATEGANGNGVARFLPDGTLDHTFGGNGFASAGFNDLGLGPSGVAIQPDGKIVWVGNTTAQVTGGTVTDFAVARFNPDGTLDSGFGRGGQVTTEFFAPPMAGAQEVADAVLVQPDGKILIGGSATQGQIKFAPKQPALLRLNASGTPDTAFGSGGRVLSAGPGNITALGLDAAGDIFTLPAYAEFSPSGQAAGSVTPAAITASSHGGAAAFLPSGQFVVATALGVARHDVDVQVQRFNAGGSVAFTSPSFDYSGASGLDQAREFVGAVAIQANGSAVAGGSHFLSTSVFGLARVNASGSLDTTFGNGGTLTTSIQGGDSAGALVIQPDGKIIAVGTSQNSTGQVDVALVRYLG